MNRCIPLNSIKSCHHVTLPGNNASYLPPKTQQQTQCRKVGLSQGRSISNSKFAFDFFSSSFPFHKTVLKPPAAFFHQHWPMSCGWKIHHYSIIYKGKQHNDESFHHIKYLIIITYLGGDGLLDTEEGGANSLSINLESTEGDISDKVS